MTAHTDDRLRSANPQPQPPAPYDDAQMTRMLNVAVVAESLSDRAPAMRWVRRGAVAAIAVTGTALLWPSTALGGIELERQGDDYVVHVTEPERSAKELTATLKSKGLNIELTTIPASPSQVGSIVGEGYETAYESEGTVKPLHEGWCAAAAGCEVGFRVPVGYQREATIEIARKAKPGERYQSSTSSFDAGERFGCRTDLQEARVPEVAALLNAAGVKVEYRGRGDSQDPEKFKDMYISDVVDISDNRSYIFASDIPIVRSGKPEGC